jgi:hypothetical protein
MTFVPTKSLVFVQGNCLEMPAVRKKTPPKNNYVQDFHSKTLSLSDPKYVGTYVGGQT